MGAKTNKKDANQIVSEKVEPSNVGTKKKIFNLESLFKIANKISVVIGIIAYGLVAVYALTMATPMGELVNVDSSDHKYTSALYNVSPLANDLLIIAIIGLLIIGVYCLLRSKSRRIYYTSNKIWGCLTVGYGVFTFIFLIYVVSYYQTQYAGIDFEYVNTMLPIFDPDGSLLNPNTSVFLLGYLLSVVCIISTALFGFVFVMKIISGKKIKSEIYRDEKVDEKPLALE